MFLICFVCMCIFFTYMYRLKIWKFVQFIFLMTSLGFCLTEETIWLIKNCAKKGILKLKHHPETQTNKKTP